MSDTNQLAEQVLDDHQRMLDSMSGEERLHLWFGLSYAGWLTIPRALMREMPEAWQRQMAQLLEEWDETWDDWTDGCQLYVAARRNGKYTSIPQWLCQYRRPDRNEIDKHRRPPAGGQ